MIKSAISASLLQSSVSHDPSEISLIYWLAAQEKILVIITVENCCVASYLCGNGDTESPKNGIYLKKKLLVHLKKIINQKIEQSLVQVVHYN